MVLLRSPNPASDPEPINYSKRKHFKTAKPSGYTFVFRIACVMQEVFVDPFGSRTTSAMPEGVCLCGWGARGPFWAPSHPFAGVYMCA